MENRSEAQQYTKMALYNESNKFSETSCVTVADWSGMEENLVGIGSGGELG